MKHKDKLLHLSISFAITVVLFPFMGMYSGILALIVGIIKEIQDHAEDGELDFWDIFANIAGVIIATLIIHLI